MKRTWLFFAGVCAALMANAQMGTELIVNGDWRDGQCTGMTLTGPARSVFRGTVDFNVLETGDSME